MLEIGLSESPVNQVLVEESLIGWDEFELEVMRDRQDNVVVVCSIENLDPMGVHTGDSVTVAPQMTLADEDYQELRDAAAAAIRAVGVETGGSNIQFARERETGELRVIEMNRACRVRPLSRARRPATRSPRSPPSSPSATRSTRSRTTSRDHAGELRADARLRRRQVPAFCLREVRRRRRGARHADEGGGRGDGNRAHLLRGIPQGDALPGARAGNADPVGDARRPPAGVHPWFRAELERTRSTLCSTGTISISSQTTGSG